MTLPITVLVSILSAQWLNAQHVSWVGLTVLFVMNVDTVTAWRKIWMRTVGTLLGVISAYIVVVFFPSVLLSFIIVLSTLFMPMFLRQNYMIFSWLMSMFVLLVVDLAMLQSGGDEFLIQWRFIDTLIGCGWVMVSLSLLHLGRKWWPNQPSKG
nr:FUSC family protein [Vibrio scophthalmi]